MKEKQINKHLSLRVIPDANGREIREKLTTHREK